jgi:beta-glucosidase
MFGKRIATAAVLSVPILLFAAVAAAPVEAASGMPPADAEAKAKAVEARMTDDERFGLIRNLMVVNFRTQKRDERVPAGTPQLAGWTPGVARLGIPDLLMTDAALVLRIPATAAAMRMVR